MKNATDNKEKILRNKKEKVWERNIDTKLPHTKDFAMKSGRKTTQSLIILDHASFQESDKH